jgi:hypothetical protein
VRVNAEHGRIVFESSPDEQALEQDQNNVSNATWQALASVMRERRARLVVWDHSVLGGDVRYALGLSIGLMVCLGDSHHFHNLVEFAQRAPEPACAVMVSMLKRGTAA